MTDGAGSQRAQESQRLLVAASAGNDYQALVATFQQGRVPDEEQTPLATRAAVGHQVHRHPHLVAPALWIEQVAAHPRPDLPTSRGDAAA